MRLNRVFRFLNLGIWKSSRHHKRRPPKRSIGLIGSGSEKLAGAVTLSDLEIQLVGRFEIFSPMLLAAPVSPRRICAQHKQTRADVSRPPPSPPFLLKTTVTPQSCPPHRRPETAGVWSPAASGPGFARLLPEFEERSSARLPLAVPATPESAAPWRSNASARAVHHFAALRPPPPLGSITGSGGSNLPGSFNGTRNFRMGGRPPAGPNQS